MVKIGFGGGRHRCAEGAVQSLSGAAEFDHGFIRCEAPWNAGAEDVTVSFDRGHEGRATARIRHAIVALFLAVVLHRKWTDSTDVRWGNEPSTAVSVA